jgi:hypothetical protein
MLLDVFFFLGILSAALLIFFPATARTRLIAPNLGSFQPNLLHFPLALRRLRGGTLLLSHRELTNLVVGRSTYIPDTPGPGARFQTDFEDNIRNSVLNTLEHLVEHSETFTLVFGLRVFFRPPSHPDTVFEMVHRIKMVFPRAVVNLHQNIFFKVA